MSVVVFLFVGGLMKGIVVGCGSIGRRHMKNLLSLGHEVVGVDPNKEYCRWVEDNIGVKTFQMLEEAIKEEKPSFCLVCTPPSTHIQIAKTAIENGLHVFIEKPISNSPEGLEELIEGAKQRNLKISVGYNLRFNKGIMKLKELILAGMVGKPLYARVEVGQYLPDWRPWQDYRKSYTASKALGGGVLLDSSHELDYVRWLLGDPDEITCIAKKISSLEVETEDCAEIILEFGSGLIANLHMDFIRRDYKRGCDIIGEKGTLQLIFNENITLFNGETKEKKVFDVKTDANEMYLEEISHFMDCIEQGKKPVCDAEDGMKTLLLVLDAKNAAEKRKTIKVSK